LGLLAWSSVSHLSSTPGKITEVAQVLQTGQILTKYIGEVFHGDGLAVLSS